MKDGETSHKNYNRNNFKKSNYDARKLQCYKCNKIWHITPNCPQRTKPNEQSNLVEEDLEPTLLMAILEDSNKEKHVKQVEEQKDSLHEEDVGYKETNIDSLWYLDSRASNHMAGVREHFKKLDEKVSGKVRFGDGSYIEIKGKGSILIECDDEKQRIISHVPSQHLTKLDDRSSRMVYLGNEQGLKAYRLFDPTTQRICVSRDVKFKENETWDWKEYMRIQPIEEDNEFPNNDDDDYASPTSDSTLHSQTPHTPSTRSSQGWEDTIVKQEDSAEHPSEMKISLPSCLPYISRHI
nr:zinc finger, CCHC-type [Tanacetum cinerariifolium]